MQASKRFQGFHKNGINSMTSLNGLQLHILQHYEKEGSLHMQSEHIDFSTIGTEKGTQLMMYMMI